MSHKRLLPRLLIFSFIISLALNIDLANANDSQDSLNLNLTPLQYLEIRSDAQLKELAQQNGWKGDGSLEHPIIIENYDFTGIKRNPQLAIDIKSASNYLQNDFNDFNLVISNVESSLIIKN